MNVPQYVVDKVFDTESELSEHDTRTTIGSAAIIDVHLNY